MQRKLCKIQLLPRIETEYFLLAKADPYHHCQVYVCTDSSLRGLNQGRHRSESRFKDNVETHGLA